MPIKRTYYEILDVSRTATQEQIKKCYRQLARRHHPDVADDKAAARLAFLQINEAYQTLTNPDKRVIYDAEMDRQIAGPTPRPGQSRRPATGGHTGSYSRRQASSSQSRTTRSRESLLVDKFLRDAEMAFIRGQLWAAIDAAKAVINLDGRNARSYVILGDVYRMQGRMDEAVSMYTIALQIDPRNADAMEKLDKAMRRSRKAQSPAGNPERKQVFKIGVGLISGSVATFLLLMLAWSPGEPIPWLRENMPIVGTWSALLITVLLGMGAMTGFLLSITDSLRALDDELVFQTVSSGRHMSYPIGLILVLVNLFNFYAAVGIYTLAGIIQDAISGSVMKAFVATACLLALIAALYPLGTREVLIWGGNLVFPALLVGWAVGDLVKPWG